MPALRSAFGIRPATLGHLATLDPPPPLAELTVFGLDTTVLSTAPS